VLVAAMSKTQKNEDDLLAGIRRPYCNFCQNPRLKITRTIKIECKRCGKTRVITLKI